MGYSKQEYLEWVAMPSTRGSSQPRDPTWVSHIAGIFFTAEYVNMTGLRDAQIAGKPIFLDVSVSMFLGEIRI